MTSVLSEDFFRLGEMAQWAAVQFKIRAHASGIGRWEADRESASEPGGSLAIPSRQGASYPKRCR